MSWRVNKKEVAFLAVVIQVLQRIVPMTAVQTAAQAVGSYLIV